MTNIQLDDLSKGSMSRIKFLAKQYGSIEAVIEASIELLIKLDTNPLLTAGARDKLNVLTDKYQGDESAVVEIALINLLKLVNQDRQPKGAPTYQQLNNLQNTNK